ncbi:hypothetical protein RD792_016473 [Penstemon davidsonii]|uniref:Uncharacterized protein n=1 Tax=Penstemon davidsonii TaxID=160366 RepID=A0ABR0CJD9_9LAMI|nr:hypothetical protein RD792_016473 [Penstemon davidsonii]
MAALGRKRISFSTKREDVSASDEHSLELAEKGHFIIYTTDKRRFSFPIAYLNSLIFRELLRMSEEEFGLPNDGPITLLCDSEFMFSTSKAVAISVLGLIGFFAIISRELILNGVTCPAETWHLNLRVV